MDSKERLIKNILLKLGAVIPNHINEVKNILTTEFNDFEVTESCREVAVRYEDNYRALQNFLCVKKIEGLSDQSLRRYATINKKFLDCVSSKPLNKIQTNDLRYYLGLCNKKGNSNVTIDGIRRIFSSFFSWLTIEGYIEHNPCLNLKQIRCEKPIKKALTDNELNEIRKACKSNRDEALVEFMYSTGMRVSEVSKCKIEDIDLENKECIVRHGKGNKQRIVYISDSCANKLKRYLNTRDYSFIQNNSLFGLSKNGIESVIGNIGKKICIHLYPHKIRRSCATNLIRAGMGIESVSKILGHSSVSTTQIYVSLDQSYIKNRYMECMNVT